MLQTDIPSLKNNEPCIFSWAWLCGPMVPKTGWSRRVAWPQPGVPGWVSSTVRPSLKSECSERQWEVKAVYLLPGISNVKFPMGTLWLLLSSFKWLGSILGILWCVNHGSVLKYWKGFYFLFEIRRLRILDSSLVHILSSITLIIAGCLIGSLSIVSWLN